MVCLRLKDFMKAFLPPTVDLLLFAAEQFVRLVPFTVETNEWLHDAELTLIWRKGSFELAYEWGLWMRWFTQYKQATASALAAAC